MSSRNIFDHFSKLSDPREDNRRHLLMDIITIVICASICGAEKWEDIETFGKAKESWFRKFIELPHGIPSHDTFSRVFALIDPDQFNRCFLSWVKSINPGYEQEIINIDGKTLRRSHDKKNGKSAIHMVSAWANRAGLILGQVKVDEKSNEIKAIPELLDLLEIHGCVVTIDAMGTQKAIAEKIVEKQADYLLALKGNQETLQDDVQLYFQDAEEEDFSIAEFDYEKTVDKDHGRIEIRECWVTDDVDWLSMKDHSAQNFEMLRHLALNLLNQEKSCKRSIAGKRLLAGWDESYLEKIIFQG